MSPLIERGKRGKTTDNVASLNRKEEAAASRFSESIACDWRVVDSILTCLSSSSASSAAALSRQYAESSAPPRAISHGLAASRAARLSSVTSAWRSANSCRMSTKSAAMCLGGI